MDRTFRLTEEQYQTLISELTSLSSYHWRDDSVHADDCGSNIIHIIEAQAEEQVPQ